MYVCIHLSFQKKLVLIITAVTKLGKYSKQDQIASNHQN